MNFPSEFGNLIVKFDVKFPTSLQVQYCTVLYCTTLYCTTQYYTHYCPFVLQPTQTSCVGDWMPPTQEVLGNVEEPKMAANGDAANYRGHQVLYIVHSVRASGTVLTTTEGIRCCT
jgi:hypothetical protein